MLGEVVLIFSRHLHDLIFLVKELVFLRCPTHHCIRNVIIIPLLCTNSIVCSSHHRLLADLVEFVLSLSLYCLLLLLLQLLLLLLLMLLVLLWLMLLLLLLIRGEVPRVCGMRRFRVETASECNVVLDVRVVVVIRSESTLSIVLLS